jgi:subtilisin family serine protease
LDDLPRHTYTLPVKPSQALQDEAVMDAVTKEVADDVQSDLARFDIQDRTTLQRYRNTELQIALLRGDYERVLELVEALRSLEEKPAPKLTTGLVSEAIAQARLAGALDSELAEEVKRRIREAAGRLPFEVVGTELKEIKAAYEIRSEALLIGQVKETFDSAFEKSGEVSGDSARTLVALRNQLVNILPLRQAIVEALEPVIEANKIEKPDRWTPRLAVLSPDTAGAQPVRIGVWDSGVDVDLFPGLVHRDSQGAAGIAFDLKATRVPELLFPLGEAEARLDTIVGNLKGWGDLQANIDSAEATALKRRMAALKPEEVRPLLEDLNIGGNWSHGTHVAGIALEGNPFARLVTGRITFDHRMIPDTPTVEQARLEVIAGQQTVDYFRAQGVRVVNMSWGGSLRGIEQALEANGAGGTAEERKKLAREIFEIGKQGLLAALKSAPEILWVAAAGNDDNDVSFDEFIPSSFQIPNLITVGAVDKSGGETSFSSFGPMVNVHANGFEVESFIPGGRRLPFSGTSMAAPQVTNLAGKILAMAPWLTPVEVKERILAGAERDGRVNLIHPLRTLEALKETAPPGGVELRATPRDIGR